MEGKVASVLLSYEHSCVATDADHVMHKVANIKEIVCYHVYEVCKEESRSVAHDESLKLSVLLAACHVQMEHSIVQASECSDEPMERGNDAMSNDHVVVGLQFPRGWQRHCVLAGEEQTCPESEEDH